MTSHKLGEWREGERLNVRFPKDRFGQIVGTCATLNDGQEVTDVLFVTNADIGLGEQLMDAFDAGFRKGKIAGEESARAEMRRALGVKDPKS
jgi:hypothetical protein